MNGILLIALLIGSSTSVNSETACRRVHRISLPAEKSELKVISRKGPLFGYLIGQTASEVLECQGEPAVKNPDAWTYHERLGPGAHTYRHSWVVKFKQGKVIEVEIKRHAVGCILIPPPREERSRP